MSKDNLHNPFAKLVDDYPHASVVLMELGIDRSRHQHETLEQVAEANGLNAHTLREVVLTDPPAVRPVPDGINWSEVPLDQLADHIISTHHGYLRYALPRIDLLASKANHDCDPSFAMLPQVCERLARIIPELKLHLQLEEEILFPQIRELVRARRTPGAPAEKVDRPVAQMNHEYEEIDREIALLRGATNGYRAPESAPAAYRALMVELAALEEDLKCHEQLENGVLFPRAIELERKVFLGHETS